MKLCKDCKHFNTVGEETRGFVAFCSNDKCGDTDPVHGTVITKAIHQLRQDDTKCGPGGIYWEAKDGQ